MKQEYTFNLALKQCKAHADKEMYSYNENIEDCVLGYHLRNDEAILLAQKMKTYCESNLLYYLDNKDYIIRKYQQLAETSH